MLTTNKLESRSFQFLLAHLELRQVDLNQVAGVIVKNHKKLLKIIYTSKKNNKVKLQSDGAV